MLGRCLTHIVGEGDRLAQVSDAADSRFNNRFTGQILDESDSLLQNKMPELFPSVPSIEDRLVNLSLENPFAEYVSRPRHLSLEKRKSATVKQAVNGYIKIRLRPNPGSVAMRSSQSQVRSLGSMNSISNYTNFCPLERIPALPPGFGRGIKLDAIDDKTLKFCTLKRSNLSSLD